MPSPVKMIRPEPIDIRAVRASIDRGIMASAEIVKVDFRLATGTWEAENEPAWEEKKPRTTKGTRVWKYQTGSTPFVWVDQGTEGPYPIPKVPKASGFLAFQPGFIPKTKPGRLVAGPGAHFGPIAFAKQVIHPGIEARDISGQVAEEADAHLPNTVQNALDKESSL